MEIFTRKQLTFFLQADRMMNRGKFNYSLKDRIVKIFLPDYIMQYLEVMRKLSYYTHKKRNKLTFILRLYYRVRFRHLGLKLGFSIGYDTCGYGLVIPHYGSLGIGGGNRLGNYCVIHTLTSITDNGKIIGDGLYLSKGAIITSPIVLGNNISIGANSVVNKSFEEDNIMIAGAPAKKIKPSESWYVRDGRMWQERVEKIENLKTKILPWN